ncbi:A24 family peptidase [Sphingobium phenoxybenzoativorans]|uniref:A24 family peptidase n=1 Tax=Sphingobium phenoxybenzoativorans TaxID=1592790 RepID=UPI000872CCE9|nr:prepilin peptidase [Sphingobium phenoxybenzoativorans]
MTGEYLRMVLLGALACMLVAAAVTDLRCRIISNRLNLAIALLAPAYWWACGINFWPDAGIQLALGLGVFALFASLFALGMMGGGDVKMLAALALWFPWQALLTLLVLMALIGGVVTVVTVIHHRVSHRLGQPEVPYGVAISLAALWLVGERYINHFV